MTRNWLIIIKVTYEWNWLRNLVQQYEITTSEWKSTTVILLRYVPTELLLCAPPSFTPAELDIGIRVLKNGKAPGLDDIQTELIKQFGPKARDWLHRFYNNCTETKKIPKIWQQANVVALLKPGKDPSVAKSFRPISLLCHTYKLFERLILNRIAEHVDAQFIPEQAVFRPGKSCTSPLLNLTEHIEDGYDSAWSPVLFSWTCLLPTTRSTTDASQLTKTRSQNVSRTLV